MVPFSWHEMSSDIFRPNPLTFIFLAGWGWNVLRGSLLMGGAKLAYEMSLHPEVSLYPNPFHPFLEEKKVNGKYDRCNSLRNELITWLSRREMRLAVESWVKGSRGVQVRGRERLVSLGQCGTWYSCLRLGERGQWSPELDHSHKSGVSLLSTDCGLPPGSNSPKWLGPRSLSKNCLESEP